MSELLGANGQRSESRRGVNTRGGSGPDLSHAAALHQAGALDDAEAAYRAVLAAQPKNADALQLLGVLTHQKGDSRKGLSLLTKALRIQPDSTGCHNNLGSVYAALGDERKAAFHFRKAAAGKAPSADAFSNLGILQRRSGDREGAIASQEEAHRLDPKATVPLSELAGLHLEVRRYAEAEAALRSYLALKPDDLMAVNNLAYAVQQQGRFDEAEALFRDALERAGNVPALGYNLRILKALQGQDAEAEALFREQIREQPEIWTAEVGFAVNLAARGYVKEGLRIFNQVLDALPDNAVVWNDIGNVLLRLGKLEDAIRVLRRATELDPGLAQAHNNLGGALLLCNHPELAAPEFKAAIKAKPDFLEPYLNLCRSLRATGEYDQANTYGHIALLHDRYDHKKCFPNLVQLFCGTCDFAGLEQLGDVWEGCDKLGALDLPALFLDLLVFARTGAEIERFVGLVERWARFQENIAAGAPLPARSGPAVAPAPRHKLRIGFLSSDFRSHSVSRFLKPLMGGYDHERFEFFCYMSVRDVGDAVQEIIKAAVDRFTFVDNKTHQEIAQAIRNDEVDILFDLNGFTQGTMMEVLAYRPAPVQMSWLGYPFTCGLSAIDHVVMDRFVMPPGGKYLVEEPVLMPDAWVCFGKFANVPIQNGLPMDRFGAPTFGTLNNPYKYTPHMIGNWARIMQEVPGSRFLMVRPEARSFTVCRNISEEFARHGIGPERLYFFDNKTQKRNHLAYYNEIDVSLDTFPLTGGTTTCEATWMGVPVVSLVGEAFQQRISYSVLMQCGLEELCTFDDESFVARAVELAGNRERLYAWRHGLRDVMTASPLCDHERFIHQFQEMLEQVAQHHRLR